MNRGFLVGIFFLMICCISCKEKVRETLQILIQNETDSPIHVTLYPKGDIGGLYPMCEGCGGYKKTEFTLSPHDDRSYYNWEEVVFYTNDLNIEPYTLASKAFDSIHISLPDKDNVTIKFAHKNVTGYSENIFSENSSWDFRIVDDALPDMGGRNPQKYHSYSFQILEDLIISE
jgi:hypothetical protein